MLLEHFEELLPIIGNPTARVACQRYGLMFKSLPRGLFVTLEDRVGGGLRFGLVYCYVGAGARGGWRAVGAVCGLGLFVTLGDRVGGGRGCVGG